MEHTDILDNLDMCGIPAKNKLSDVSITSRLPQEEYARMIRLYKKMGLTISKSAFARVAMVLLLDIIEKMLNKGE